MRWKSLVIVGVLLVVLGLSLAFLPKEWIEERFGFEPDGGNGWIEFLLAAIPLLLGVALLIKAIAMRRDVLSVSRGSPV